jgi:DNA polymerase-3 subunit epsilon
MARRIFPGLPKYGLASLCHHFTIKNDARHRAYGDALATTELLMLLLTNDKSGELTKLAKKRKQSQYLPPNLKTDIADKIPSLPGVYYFHNNKGKIIYVGKAVNLKKRINSHFSNNKATKQKQDFLREIFEITWKDCSSDLTASIFESIEIRRLWPKFNKSQKHYERQYGIFMFEDNLGHQRLAIDTTKKIIEPLATFQLLVDARQMLFMLCEKFDIEHYMFFLSKETPLVKPPKDEHNEKVAEIIIYLKQSKQNFLLHDGAKHYLLVNNGKFCAMGKIEILTKNPKLEKVRTHLTAYSNNTTIESYIKKYVLKSPESVIAI